MKSITSMGKHRKAPEKEADRSSETIDKGSGKSLTPKLVEDSRDALDSKGGGKGDSE